MYGGLPKNEKYSYLSGTGVYEWCNVERKDCPVNSSFLKLFVGYIITYI